jgi:hypothetical protein
MNRAINFAATSPCSGQWSGLGEIADFISVPPSEAEIGV